jgi:NADH-quinone oxidoreductase subunit N
MPVIFQDMLLLSPEIFLFVNTVVLLLVGLYGGKPASKWMCTLAVLVLLVTLALTSSYPNEDPITVFGGLLLLDGFTHFCKAMVIAAAILVLVIAQYWQADEEEPAFEFPVLLLLSTLGMMLMISANDLLSLYMALELMSLSLYILASFQRDSLLSTEAGIKYFVLGSLASGMLLFGASLVYGFTGTTSFAGIAQLLEAHAGASGGLEPSYIGIVIGMVLVIIGFCFKISAVPFHMWTPDVYQGAPTPVTAFFAMAPKVAAMALFARFLLQPFGPWLEQWQPIVIAVSIGSMLVGAFGALVQTNIKRLLAYSSIGHVGYALMGIAAGTVTGVKALLIYLAIYLVMTAGIFACVMLMRRGTQAVEDIDALSGLSRNKPYLAAAIGIFMFSLAGIPPLAGFFGKFYVFMAALEAGLYWLAVIGVLSSVVAAYYYLRIIKLMYFDEEKERLVYELPMSLRYLLILTVGGTSLFFLFPAPLVEVAQQAASALWL